jgi:hypothetical protein
MYVMPEMNIWERHEAGLKKTVCNKALIYLTKMKNNAWLWDVIQIGSVQRYEQLQYSPRIGGRRRTV